MTHREKHTHCAKREVREFNIASPADPGLAASEPRTQYPTMESEGSPRRGMSSGLHLSTPVPIRARVAQGGMVLCLKLRMVFPGGGYRRLRRR